MVESNITALSVYEKWSTSKIPKPRLVLQDLTKLKSLYKYDVSEGELHLEDYNSDLEDFDTQEEFDRFRVKAWTRLIKFLKRLAEQETGHKIEDEGEKAQSILDKPKKDKVKKEVTKRGRPKKELITSKAEISFGGGLLPPPVEEEVLPPPKTGLFIRDYLKSNKIGYVSEIHTAYKNLYRGYKSLKGRKVRVSTYLSFAVYCNQLKNAGLIRGKKVAPRVQSANEKGLGNIEYEGLMYIVLTPKGRSAPDYVWERPIRLWYKPYDWERSRYSDYIKPGS